MDEFIVYHLSQHQIDYLKILMQEIDWCPEANYEVDKIGMDNYGNMFVSYIHQGTSFTKKVYRTTEIIENIQHGKGKPP